MPVSVIENASFGNSGIVTANGIKFPATQVASADANTLDDYEEGTWTPVLNFNNSPTGITYTRQIGRYTKIGRIVSLQFNIVLSNKGSNAGAATITGLPFPGYNGPANNAPMQAGWVVAEREASGWSQATYGLVWNDSRMYIRYNNGTTLGETNNGNFTNTTEFYYSCTYEIA
jgi:hypothetical protein